MAIFPALQKLTHMYVRHYDITNKVSQVRSVYPC